MAGVHYLQKELGDLIQRDFRIWSFIQESSLDGVWYWDLEEPENEWMSPEFWRLFGYDPATREHKVSEWQDLIFPQDLETAVENFNKHLADPNHPYDQVVRYHHADGLTVWVRCRGMAIRDASGKAVRFIGAHNDLTAVKRAEEEARAANLLKSQFLANMSHEIRTPLNGVLGMAQLLSRTDLDDRQRDYIRILTSSGTALLEVIEDILDISKIEAGMLRLETREFSLHRLFDTALSGVKGAAEIKGLTLETTLQPGMPDYVCGDETRLRQVLLNLLGNAVKFTSEGVIGLEARWTDARLVVDITDTGPGVPQAMQAHIFDRFRQASEGLARVTEGTGLGLAISKEIAELAGGTVTLVDPQPTLGAHFRLEIPLTPAAGESAQPILGQGSEWVDLSETRVLVVEDHLANRTVLVEYLRASCADVVSVTDGASALDCMREHSPFDVVVMDMHMPRMSGAEAMRAMRLHGDGTPVIMVTADAAPATSDLLLDAGARCVLTKPLDLSRLAVEIRGAARDTRLARSA
jgi:hypothetical protein